MQRTSVLLKTVPEHARVWHEIFRAEAPDLDLLDWQADGTYPGTRFFAAWQPPADLMRQVPDLRLMFSVAAGLDHLPLASLPPEVVVVRMVAEDVTRSMVEYVTWAVLTLHRDLHLSLGETRRGLWHQRFIRRASSRSVGILGLGVLGGAAARALADLGFPVRGWSTSPKAIPGVQCFSGEGGLDDLLKDCEILVCLLPLTEETRGILNAGLFERLPPGAMLINAGRGGHLVEAEFLAALDEGRIGAAILDVLSQEPPAPDHPLLTHPNVLVTPHTASASQPDQAARQMIAAVRSFVSGLPVAHSIQRAKGF